MTKLIDKLSKQLVIIKQKDSDSAIWVLHVREKTLCREFRHIKKQTFMYIGKYIYWEWVNINIGDYMHNLEMYIGINDKNVLPSVMVNFVSAWLSHEVPGY